MGSCLCLMILIILGSNLGVQSDLLQLQKSSNNQSIAESEAIKPRHQFSSPRKILVHGSCTNRDISISQSRDSTSGIPQYIVLIVNTCLAGCAPSNIHLHCGWFASARLVNPRAFKRLFYDDCLVNEGKPLETSDIIRFTYSNSFMYELRLKYAKFC